MQFLRHKQINRKNIIHSLLCALLLVIVGYFWNNSPIFTAEPIKRLHFYNRILGTESSQNSDNDIAYFNCAYDRCLVPVIQNSDTVGSTAIVDRHTLNAFLKLVKECDNYRFIILDIFLEKTDNDFFENDSLYLTLKSFGDKIVLPTPENHNNFAYPDLIKHTAESYHLGTKTSKAFIRYKYLHSAYPSIPLYTYCKLHSKDHIKRLGLLDWLPINEEIKDAVAVYTFNNKLCHNSLFLNFDNGTIIKPNNYISDKNGDTPKNKGKLTEKFSYWNIGKELTEPVEPGTRVSGLANRINDKIVVIADLSGKQDTHITYMDKKAGAEIIMSAFKSIENGKIYVSAFHQIFWFFVFFIVSLIIHRDRPVFDKLFRNKLLSFLFSIISYGTILLIAEFADFAIFGRVYSVTVALLIFTLMKLNIQYKRYELLEKI